MARKPDTPCSSCGRLLWSGGTSLPAGQRTCQPCRRVQPRRQVNPRQPADYRPADCPGCGNAIPYEKRKQKYCSRACIARPARKPKRYNTYRHRVTHWASYRDGKNRGRAGRPYRRWRDAVLAADVPVCCRCGGDIDKSLPWQHPMAATADHYPVPLSLWAGDPLDPGNGAPAHRGCNLSAGNRAEVA